MQVKIKAGPEWKNYRRCHLGISLGNANAAGTPLEAIIDWINEQQFEHLFIDLSDTLHRHNFKHLYGLDEKRAFLRGREEGDKWLEQNLPRLNKLDVPWDLYRWEHWLKEDKAASYLDRFRAAFVRDTDFRAALLNDVRSFTRRSGAILDMEQMRHGAAYLLEELAVLSYYFDTYPCLKIYPGKEQGSFKMVRLGQVKDVPSGLQNIYYAQLWLHDEQKETNLPRKALVTLPAADNLNRSSVQQAAC